MKDAAPIVEKIAHVPDLPGVYQYIDRKGDILYIGKAKSLKKRVRSYFQPSANHNYRIGLMVSLVHDVLTIITNTEAEALILEAQLIKTHQPRYNIALKDDKSYPYFKLALNEMYPRLFLVREKFKKSSEYYGPYTSVRDARKVLGLINKFFLLRTSKMELNGTKTYRPCLNFQLKRCLAPCRGDVPETQYREEVQQVRMFLQGKYKELIKYLESKMYKASESLEFEKAARTRDQINAIERTFEKQLVLSPASEDMDIFALYRDFDFAGIEVLFIRYGRLLATDFFFFDSVDQVSDDNLIGQILNRIYMSESYVIPQKILLPFLYSDQDGLVHTLNEKSHSKVSILVPKRGDKKKAIELAYRNAESHLVEKKRQHVQAEEVLQKMQKTLHLQRLPKIIEAFDISHISGSHTVASMVCWKDNKPHKAGYRKFKIKNVEGIDDFACMTEVLTRHYRHAVYGEQPLPDLILIDGGKGQLNVAVHVLKELGILLEKVDVIGLAKGRTEKKRGGLRNQNEDFEYVVKPNQKNEIRIHRNSPVLYLLQNIRDESHRFAIKYHRSLRRKASLHSSLDDIPGIGKQRKQNLIQHFGSFKKLKNASREELQKTPGISQNIAQQIYHFFHE
ncbi:MAG: excinuclease ABC subunit UvrC [SAR324 cluster bacterium]|nr:excinuclease ABC subunit UvrC [SAR324 cluster bacterium]